MNNICKTFNINEQWLKCEDGEMFIVSKTTAIQLLIKEYNLSAEQTEFVNIFIEMPEKKRDSVAKAFFEFVNATRNYENRHYKIQQKLTIDEKVAAYRTKLEREEADKMTIYAADRPDTPK